MLPENVNDFIHELQTLVRGEVRSDEVSRAIYSNDASIYQVKPYGVFLPRSVEEIQAAVELAHQRQIPLLPRGGGTSLAGQTVNEALVIDTSPFLNQILEINPEERWARVQPGVYLASLNAQLKPLGLKYGPDPATATRASMGGILGNNSSGSHSILYGMSADHILAVKALLNDGSLAAFGPKTETELEQICRREGREAEITRQMLGLLRAPGARQAIERGTPKHWRRCGGYNLERLTDGQGFSFRLPHDPRFNLAKLICGSEGTLAFATEITVNLTALPRQTALAVVHFADLRPSLEAIPAILELNPASAELFDRYTMALVENAPDYARMMRSFIHGQPDNALVVEFYGDSLPELQARLNGLREHLRRRGVPFTDLLFLTDPAAIETVWKVRTAGFGILMSMRGDVKPLEIVDDCAVPPEYLPDYIFKLESFCKQELDHEISYFAHASAGCLHVHNMLNAKLESDIAKFPRIAAYAAEILKEYGGVLSSEHGDGRLRSWLNPVFFGEDLYALFRQVKGIFDPQNLFNPGNIVEAPAITENLRYGPSYRALPLQPFLNFEEEQGFDRAVEMCNGTALCRQLAGSMCPTYKATRDERLSTRGRANALRAAISGGLDFASPQVYDTLDLCVSCKACKSECPSTVDMAKLKAEYLHQVYQTRPMPLRSRFFAHIADLSRLASGWRAPFANLALTLPPLRQTLAHLLGLARQRSLPRFAPQTFRAWQNRRQAAGSRPVILLVDVIHNYNDPAPAQAAQKVLEAAGFTPITPPAHDLGRPAFSKGDLPLARRRAQAALHWLTPHAQAGVPILSLEPSDLSMLRDDYFNLLPDDPRVKLVAAQTHSLEELLWQEKQAGRLEGIFQPQSGQILLHGHCHQKALTGTKITEALLASLGYTVQEAGSACCGMAGSFGYEAEHYELSQQMGERSLFPAVRAAEADTLIVATGVSCHQQIEDGTGRRPLHPAEALALALKQP